MKKYICILLVGISTSAFAHKPAWARMMNSEHANYFKAVKKYDRYWQKHFTPGEEEEHENAQKLKDESEHDPRPLLVRIFQSEERGKENSQKLCVEYKGFKKWKMEMLPYVKSDGSIMTPDERVAAWNQLKNL
jgi:hypothetical protein